MTEEKTKKRGWVKNAAIIFLAIMLVLTFFSNTIMNRSLPEVAAQYTQPGTISANIRGTGTIEAVESFAVKTEQTRKVLSVPVTLGDEVAVGDTLIIYGEAGSDELKAAQDTLDSLVQNYQKALINSSAGQYSGEKAAILEAENALNAAVSKRDANIVSDADVAGAAARVASSELALSKAQAALEAVGEPVPSSQGDRTALTAAENTLAAKKLQYKAELISFNATVKGELEKPENKEIPLDAYKEYLSAVYSSKDVSTNEHKQHIAYTEVKEADNDYNIAKAEYDSQTTSGNMAQYNARKAEVGTAQRNFDSAKSAQETLLGKKSVYDAALAEVGQCQKSLQDALLMLQKNVALENIDFNVMQKQISDQNKLIADLKGGGEASVKSAVNGVVTAINVTAGDTTAAGSELLLVEVPDRGYKLSFSVTKEQSQKVRVGDMGEMLYNYWGPTLSARLSLIRTDVQNPTTNKILDFIIEGEDVEGGSQVSISIGERSSNYDLIVPNSAIRSDTNGKFVLAVISKNSPLGNRYIATRVDVEVLATDDMNSAVSGALVYGDFVITTSTKPVESGTQVRLADQVDSDA